MAAPEDVDQWISDARDTGIPVLSTGVLLLMILTGLPLLVASPVVLAIMVSVQFIFARRLLAEPED